MIAPVKTPENSEIPHIFHVIPSFAHGGVPIRISYLMNHFGPRARHTLLSTDNIYSCQSRLNEDVDYSIPDFGLAGQSNIMNRIWQYRRSLRRIKPDLLLTYNWGSTEWALANSIAPLCRHYHLESGFGPEEAEKTLPRRNWFRRLALRNIEAIVVPSHTLINICKNDWKIPENRIRYIPNGVDCDLYSSSPESGIITGFKKQPGQIVIGTMTPLRPEKNLPRLITAFRHLRQSCPEQNFAQNFALIIMGEGRERPALEKLIAHYGLQDNIYLPGHIDTPAFALGWLDIYALSSDTEQMPNAVNQAMAAGLPIVGLDVGDVKYMVHDDNKPYIAPAGDDPAFTKALTALATDKKRREDIGLANKKHVRENFDQSRMFREYGKIWRVAPDC